MLTTRWLIRTFLVGALACATIAPAQTVEFANAAQPQLAASTDGRVWVTFGRGQEILVAGSTDGGATFGAPVRVAALPSLMLGRRRGPRIAAHGDNVTVTAMAGELFAFRSKDSGKTWTGPALINDVPRSAREGLNGLAVAPDGRLFATWLDLRSEKTQLFGAASVDGGATWSANQLIYASPGGTICECCHPSAAFNDRGDLAAMWRNSIGGARDMWWAVQQAGEKNFGMANKLGTRTWTLKACPMDGGAIVGVADRFVQTWMNDGTVYDATPELPESRVAKGAQPVIAISLPRIAVVWQQGAELWWSGRCVDCQPTLLARNGRFPSAVGLPGRDRILVAYERGSGVVVQPL